MRDSGGRGFIRNPGWRPAYIAARIGPAGAWLADDCIHKPFSPFPRPLVSASAITTFRPTTGREGGGGGGGGARAYVTLAASEPFTRLILMQVDLWAA